MICVQLQLCCPILQLMVLAQVPCSSSLMVITSPETGWCVSVLAAANIDMSQYCGHSFRIGAATTAARAGVEDSLIKTMGRWESVAYLRYTQKISLPQ